MPTKRIHVDDLEGPPQIRPTASPIDTYVRPSPVQPSAGLGDLVKSLAGFQKDIGGFLEQAAFRDQDEELKKGKLTADDIAAREKNRTDFKAAVSQGLIPAGASPWFIKGYNQQFGRLLG